MQLSDIFPKDGKVQRIYCDKCGKHTTLSSTTFDDHVEDVHIIIENFHVLTCERCGVNYLPDRSRIEIISTFMQAKKHNQKEVKVKQRKQEEKFSFTDVPFIYDSDDYNYIPGLVRENDTGFLTPVFFNKHVLIKFDNSPEYRIYLASKTYGNIIKGDNYSISFGINENNKVIMWLGDIAKLPTKEQYYLCSENIESDHKIGSEFYDGQIECVFTKPSPEDKLIKSRSDFHEFAYKKFGERLTHLDEEILSIIDELNPPVLHTEKEKRHIADLLNKINVESLKSVTVGKLIEQRGKNPEKLSGLKKLQQLFELEYPNKPISKIVSPLFVLYDLRIAYTHLMSESKKKKIINAVCDRLGILNKDVNFEVIYMALLKQLIDCYQRLSKFDIKND